MMEIDGYVLGRLLGQGQFGQTYEAEKNGQKVALKLIREEAVLQGFDVDRFNREVRSLQKVSAPNVVRLIDSGSARLGNATRYFIALELLCGEDLGRHLAEVGHSLSEDKIKAIVSQVIAGLESIHEHNIVHRDLKPGNIFLTDDGRIKLLDFGLVKMLDYTTLTTLPGRPIGTPLYMAPEILRGDEVDYRADFYSLGVLLYCLVTGGKYPLTARTPIELYTKVVGNPPIPPTRYASGLSSDFENTILGLLAKHPYERPLMHREIQQVIKDTPMLLSGTASTLPQVQQTSQPKQCYFRVLHNESGDVERFVKAGGKMDGIVFAASFLPRYRKAVRNFKEWRIPCLLDPVSYRLPYSSFAQTQGVVNLPYVPDPDNVLAPEDLQTLAAQQTYAHKCIDWQLEWGGSPLVAPFHFNRNLESPWMDVDVKLIEESISHVRQKGLDHPVYAGLCVNIEGFSKETNRLALLNRYSRAGADGYMFYVDALDERTNNRIQVSALLKLLQLFQRLSKPVIACRVGTLGLGLLAAGVDGITSGLASLSSFKESSLLVNRSQDYSMKKRYYIPGMMLTLQAEMAEDILRKPQNAHLRCNCVHCQGRGTNLAGVSKAHFLHARAEEVRHLENLSGSVKRLAWFRERVESAQRNCESIRRQQVKLSPGYFAHFRTWLQVFK